MNKKEFFKLVENPQGLNEETLGSLKEITAGFPFFQAGWMLYLKNLKNTGNPEYEKVLKKVALLVPDRKQLQQFLQDENKTKQVDFDGRQNYSPDYNLGENDEPETGNSLIDKFLSSQPGPIRLEKESNTEESILDEDELVERSESEDDELITETLAMIYFEQKKYDKALDAFRKLSLKYPEKSIYFASRIEEIKKLKNI